MLITWHQKVFGKSAVQEINAILKSYEKRLLVPLQQRMLLPFPLSSVQCISGPKRGLCMRYRQLSIREHWHKDMQFALGHHSLTGGSQYHAV